MSSPRGEPAGGRGFRKTWLLGRSRRSLSRPAVLGPSGVRDAGGVAFDAVLTLNPSDMLFDGLGWAARGSATLGVYSLKAVDARHQVKFRYYETGSPFEYQLVRFVYTKKRELDIAK